MQPGGASSTAPSCEPHHAQPQAVPTAVQAEQRATLSILLAMLQAGAAQDPAREAQLVTAGETAHVAEARRMPAGAPAPTQNSQSLGMVNAQAAPQLASKQQGGDAGSSASNGTSASAGPGTGTGTTGTAQPQHAQHAKRARNARQPSPGLGGTPPVRMPALALKLPSSTHRLQGPQPPPPPPPPLRPMHQQPAAMQNPTAGMAGTGKPGAPFGAVRGPGSSAPAAPAPGPGSSAPAAPALKTQALAASALRPGSSAPAAPALGTQALAASALRPGSSAPAAPAPAAPTSASTVVRPMPNIASYLVQRANVSVMISSAAQALAELAASRETPRPAATQQSGPAPSKRQPGPAPPPQQPGPAPSKRQPGPAPSKRQPGPAPPLHQPDSAPSLQRPGPAPSPQQPGPAPPLQQPGPAPPLQQPGPAPPLQQPGPAPPLQQPGPAPPLQQPGPAPPLQQPGPAPPLQQPGLAPLPAPAQAPTPPLCATPACPSSPSLTAPVSRAALPPTAPASGVALPSATPVPGAAPCPTAPASGAEFPPAAPASGLPCKAASLPPTPASGNASLLSTPASGNASLLSTPACKAASLPPAPGCKTASLPSTPVTPAYGAAPLLARAGNSAVPTPSAPAPACAAPPQPLAPNSGAAPLPNLPASQGSATAPRPPAPSAAIPPASRGAFTAAPAAAVPSATQCSVTAPPPPAPAAAVPPACQGDVAPPLPPAPDAAVPAGALRDALAALPLPLRQALTALKPPTAPLTATSQGRQAVPSAFQGVRPDPSTSQPELPAPSASHEALPASSTSQAEPPARSNSQARQAAPSTSQADPPAPSTFQGRLGGFQQAGLALQPQSSLAVSGLLDGSGGLRPAQAQPQRCYLKSDCLFATARGNPRIARRGHVSMCEACGEIFCCPTCLDGHVRGRRPGSEEPLWVLGRACKGWREAAPGQGQGQQQVVQRQREQRRKRCFLQHECCQPTPGGGCLCARDSMHNCPNCGEALCSEACLKGHQMGLQPLTGLPLTDKRRICQWSGQTCWAPAQAARNALPQPVPAAQSAAVGQSVGQAPALLAAAQAAGLGLAPLQQVLAPPTAAEGRLVGQAPALLETDRAAGLGLALPQQVLAAPTASDHGRALGQAPALLTSDEAAALAASRKNLPQQAVSAAAAAVPDGDAGGAAAQAQAQEAALRLSAGQVAGGTHTGEPQVQVAAAALQGGCEGWDEEAEGAELEGGGGQDGGEHLRPSIEGGKEWEGWSEQEAGEVGDVHMEQAAGEDVDVHMAMVQAARQGAGRGTGPAAGEDVDVHMVTERDTGQADTPAALAGGTHHRLGAHAPRASSAQSALRASEDTSWHPHAQRRQDPLEEEEEGARLGEGVAGPREQQTRRCRLRSDCLFATARGNPRMVYPGRASVCEACGASFCCPGCLDGHVRGRRPGSEEPLRGRGRACRGWRDAAQRGLGPEQGQQGQGQGQGRGRGQGRERVERQQAGPGEDAAGAPANAAAAVAASGDALGSCRAQEEDEFSPSVSEDEEGAEGGAGWVAVEAEQNSGAGEGGGRGDWGVRPGQVRQPGGSRLPAAAPKGAYQQARLALQPQSLLAVPGPPEGFRGLDLAPGAAPGQPQERHRRSRCRLRSDCLFASARGNARTVEAEHALVCEACGEAFCCAACLDGHVRGRRPGSEEPLRGRGRACKGWRDAAQRGLGPGQGQQGQGQLAPAAGAGARGHGQGQEDGEGRHSGSEDEEAAEDGAGWRELMAIVAEQNGGGGGGGRSSGWGAGVRQHGEERLPGAPAADPMVGYQQAGLALQPLLAAPAPLEGPGGLDLAPGSALGQPRARKYRLRCRLWSDCLFGNALGDPRTVDTGHASVCEICGAGFCCAECLDGHVKGRRPGSEEPLRGRGRACRGWREAAQRGLGPEQGQQGQGQRQRGQGQAQGQQGQQQPMQRQGQQRRKRCFLQWECCQPTREGGQLCARDSMHDCPDCGVSLCCAACVKGHQMGLQPLTGLPLMDPRRACQNCPAPALATWGALPQQALAVPRVHEGWSGRHAPALFTPAQAAAGLAAWEVLPHQALAAPSAAGGWSGRQGPRMAAGLAARTARQQEAVAVAAAASQGVSEGWDPDYPDPEEGGVHWGGVQEGAERVRPVFEGGEDWEGWSEQDAGEGGDVHMEQAAGEAVDVHMAMVQAARQGAGRYMGHAAGEDVDVHVAAKQGVGQADIPAGLARKHHRLGAHAPRVSSAQSTPRASEDTPWHPHGKRRPAAPLVASPETTPLAPAARARPDAGATAQPAKRARIDQAPGVLLEPAPLAAGAVGAAARHPGAGVASSRWGPPQPPLCEGQVHNLNNAANLAGALAAEEATAVHVHHSLHGAGSGTGPLLSAGQVHKLHNPAGALAAEEETAVHVHLHGSPGQQRRQPMHLHMFAADRIFVHRPPGVQPGVVHLHVHQADRDTSDTAGVRHAMPVLDLARPLGTQRPAQQVGSGQHSSHEAGWADHGGSLGDSECAGSGDDALLATAGPQLAPGQVQDEEPSERRAHSVRRQQVVQVQQQQQQQAQMQTQMHTHLQHEQQTAVAPLGVSPSVSPRAAAADTAPSVPRPATTAVPPHNPAPGVARAAAFVQPARLSGHGLQRWWQRSRQLQRTGQPASVGESGPDSLVVCGSPGQQGRSTPRAAALPARALGSVVAQFAAVPPVGRAGVVSPGDGLKPLKGAPGIVGQGQPPPQRGCAG